MLATKADLAGTKADLQAALAGTKAELKAEIAEARAEILKWMFGMVGVQTLVILGALVTLLRIGLRP